MLSPHEFAALLLVTDTPNPSELDPVDIASLVERQLVALEELASGRHRFRLTTDGDMLVKTVSRNQ